MQENPQARTDHNRTGEKIPWTKFHQELVEYYHLHPRLVELYGQLEFAVGKNGACWPSIPTLARKIGLQKLQTIRWINRLEELRLIRRICSKGRPNVYEILPPDPKFLRRCLGDIPVSSKIPVSPKIPVSQKIPKPVSSGIPPLIGRKEQLEKKARPQRAFSGVGMAAVPKTEEKNKNQHSAAKGGAQAETQPDFSPLPEWPNTPAKPVRQSEFLRLANDPELPAPAGPVKVITQADIDRAVAELHAKKASA